MLCRLIADGLVVPKVDYPADVNGFLAGGDVNGSITFAQYINDAYTKCPNTKLSISGYSQGAQLVHNAAALLSQAETDFVTSAVVSTVILHIAREKVD